MAQVDTGGAARGEAMPSLPCDICGQDVPYIEQTPGFLDPTLLGHRGCVDGKVRCDVCHKPAGDLFSAKRVVGHKDCVQAERVATPEEFAAKMRECHTPDPVYGDTGNPMTDHLAGEKAMGEMLRALGYGEGVDVWESLDKWYR